MVGTIKSWSRYFGSITLAGHSTAGNLSGFSFKELILVQSVILPSVLFICMIFDLQNRQVPLPLTLGLLVGSAIYALFHALRSPVMLTFLLCFIAEFNPRMRRNAIAVMLTAFSILLQPATYPICLACLVFWMLWEFNILGGADAKLLIAETLIVGTPWFYLPVAVVGGIQGIIAGFRRQKDIPFVVAISCGTLLFLFFQQEYVWGKGI